MKRAWPNLIVFALGCGHAPPRPLLPPCDASSVDATVAVLGAVERPGSYAVVGSTLSIAIAAAGGITALGVRRHVVVRRAMREGTRAAIYDLEREPDLLLCPNDLVEVPIRD